MWIPTDLHTGLSLGQIEAGVMWQNVGFLRWRQQFGKPDSDE